MIYKVDHIAFSSHDFERDAELLKKMGYANRFWEKDKINFDATKMIMRSPSDRFDIALFEKEGNVGIELLDYGHSFEMDEERCVWQSLPASLEIFAEQNERFSEVVLKSAEPSASARLWELCRFKTVEENFDFIRMEFKPLFGGDKLSIRIVKTEKNNISYIDDKGFSIYAFMCSKPESVRLKLIENGYQPTVISFLPLNGNMLKIFFVRNCSGEVLEFISVDGRTE